ncbi:MAG: hypothetical protein J1F23_06940 [Oscillospiraceae bacterium]|nr:hypothetical protein [Oscillospiraceae bacterium]
MSNQTNNNTQNTQNLTYTQKKQLLQQSIMGAVQSGNYKPAFIRQYGECAYRLDVFDNINVLTVTAPVTTDSDTIRSHWGFVTRLLDGLKTERIPNNLTAEQATAKEFYENVVESNKKVLAGFEPSKYAADTYRKTVLQILQTSYDAFILFRNTLIKC